MRVDDVAWDDEQEPLPEVGGCEFARDVTTSRSGQPRVLLCGKPGPLRGIAYACDDCWERYRERNQRK